MRVSKWQRAASFAAKAHNHQRRDDGQTPYFSHPARVALTVAHQFGCEDEDALAAAFLHDTIEDTQVNFNDVAEEFGEDVAGCVAALTNNMILPEKDRQKDYEKRLQEADWRARLVKLADEYDNYSSVLAGEKESSDGKERKKCKRAMAIAKPDAKSHPETRQAIDALRKLIRNRP